jgi:S1-C subfamily serine protease
MVDADRVSRRQVLATSAGALAALAGCTEGTATREQYDPPETVRTRAPDETVQPTGTPPAGRFRAAYDATAESVAAVRVDGGQGTCYATDDAHLVTNQHVVEDAEQVSIQYARDDWGPASVVATDVYSDLAVLADADRPGYVTPLSLAGYPPAVGQEVIVIGTPFGLRGTLTTGVVSGVGRALEAATGFSVPGAIQTDAAVNPGNSGGPLLSLDGEVVGVISAGGGENIGFGIPPQLVRRVVPDLIEFGDYQHPFLGVSLADVTPAVAERNDFAQARGAIVLATVDGGPADGVLRPSRDRSPVPVGGDVIVGLDGVPIDSVADLLTYLAFRAFPGDRLGVTVVRDGSERTVELTVGVRPGP